MVGWIPIISVFLCFGFVVWLHNYYRQSYLKQLTRSIQDALDVLLDIADKVDEISEQINEFKNER